MKQNCNTAFVFYEIQSQERILKLRAELIVEEQRKEELSKILKEVLSSPDSSGSCQTMPKRRVHFSIFFLTLLFHFA
jgi:predicted RNase H-related nuclease YkuK (DUF458 family)